MGLWKRFTTAVKRFFSGGGSSPSRRVVNNPTSRRVVSSNTRSGSARRAYLNAYKGERDDLKRDSRRDSWEKTKNAFKASSSKATPPDPKDALREKARKEYRAERAEWHKATNNRYNVAEKGISEEDKQKRRQNIKMRPYDSKTAVAEQKHAMKHHKKAESFARGALSGTTFGASDLVAKYGTKGEAKKAENVYQKNKSKGWETAGEIAGSLAAFGLTSGASKAVVKKALPRTTKFATKQGAKVAEKLATTKLVQKAAKNEVANAVKKGLAKEATKETVDRVAKQKAKEVITNLGEDAAVNLTTAKLDSAVRAVKDTKSVKSLDDLKDSNVRKEVAKNFLKNDAANVALSSVATVGLPAAGKGIKRALGGVSEGVENVVKKDNAAYEALARKAGLSTLELPRVSAKKQAPKVKVDLGRKRTTDLKLGSINANKASQATIEDVIKKEPPHRQETIEDVVADAASNRQTTIDDVVNAGTEETRVRNAKDNIIAEMEEAHRVAADTSRPDAERQAAADRWSELNDELNKAQSISTTKPSDNSSVLANISENESSNRQTIIEDRISDESDKTSDDVINDNLAEDLARRRKNASQIKESREAVDKVIRKESEGAVGVRKGVESVGKGVKEKEQKRIFSTMAREADDFVKGNLDTAGVRETLYDTWNGARKMKAAEESYDRALGNSSAIFDEMAAKLKAFQSDPSKGTNLSITDVMDMIATKRVYEAEGKEFPQEIQAVYDALILANKTEHAQGLSVVEQILRDFDPDYRRIYITKDFDKFVSRFGNIKDLKATTEYFDRKYGAGALENRLDELVNYDYANGSVDEYKSLYAALQRDLLRTAKPSLWNVLDATRHTFMLSNLATGLRNIYGNVTQRVMYNIADSITAGFERSIERKLKNNPAFAKKMGEGFERTTKTLRSSDNRLFARNITNGKIGSAIAKSGDASKSAKDAEYFEYLTKIANEDIPELMGVEKLMPHLEKGADFVAKTGGEKILATANRISQKGSKAVSFMLNEPDSIFVERNYRSALAKYLEANGITDMKSLSDNKELFERARAHAKDVALENTYKKANRITTLLERARSAGKREGSNALAKVGAAALDTRLPYVKVPSNMFINNVKYSPIGLLQSSTKAYKAMASGDAVALERAVAEMSKGVTGSMLMALGLMLHCDEQEQADSKSWGVIGNAAEYLKEYGVRDYSLKVGDYNFKLSDIGLGATQFLMGAVYADAINENGGAPRGLLDYPDAILQAFGSTLDVISDETLLDNFTQIFDTFAGNGYKETLSEKIGNVAIETVPMYVNQYIPNPLRAVAKGTTEADLDTGVKKGSGATRLGQSLQRNVNNFIQGVPIKNEKVLPHKVDTHGRLISTGLFPEGRDTSEKKALQSLVNFTDPLSTRKINIPEVDKEEMSVKKLNSKTGEETDTPWKPHGFDSKREYNAKVGTGKNAETIDLTGKEREQVARSATRSGRDGIQSLVDSGMFGDRLGEEAQYILSIAPENDEDARALIFSTPQWKNADNAQRNKWLNKYYGQGSGNSNKGVTRTRKEEAYVNVAGNSEGDFRFQNDLHYKQQDKYYNNNLESVGIDKGTWADIVQACKDSNHKWKEDEQKNVDSINSAKKTKAGILSVEGLTPEQRIAAYQAFRGKQTGFGWNDWDGVSLGGSGRKHKGSRKSGRRGRGGSSKTVKTSVPIKVSDFKADKATYKDMASALKTRSTSKRKRSTPKRAGTKIEPPKVKFKKYEV